jgi:hypothetical protein
MPRLRMHGAISQFPHTSSYYDAQLNSENMFSPLSDETLLQTLVDFQLDAQNSYLFIYNTFTKILYVFRALLCSSSGGPRHNCMYAYIQLKRGHSEDEQGNAYLQGVYVVI